jgi:iron complex outermembrane receptor protein
MLYRSSFNASLLLGTSMMAFAALAAPGYAQNTAAKDPSKDFELVIVTGTRVQGMTAADSAEPVTVVDSSALTKGSGSTDLRQSLGQMVPSFSAQQYGSDTAAFSLSAALRGLSPDDTLVLVDGHRRHYTGNLHVNGGNFASGSSSPDISLIPQIAIDHVEVLLDGAAAQYGTDAVAGVVNIITKNASSGGLIQLTGGQYYRGDGATFDVSGNIGLPLLDKGYVNISASKQTHDYTQLGGPDSRYINAQGLPTPTGTVGAAPNAAGIIPCSGGVCIPTTGPSAVTGNFGYPRTNLVNGDGEYQLQMAAVQAGYDFSDDLHVYFEGTIGSRTAKANENVRLPNQVIASPGSNAPCSATNPQGYNTAQTASGTPACAIGVSTTGSASGAGAVLLAGSVAATPGVNSRGTIISSGQAGTLFTPGELVMYPQDMHPVEGLREIDYQYNVGVGFKLLGFGVDANIGYGKDVDKIYTLNSAVRSLFIDTHTSPKDFYDGQFIASQFVGTIDASRPFDVGLASPLTVAFGGEAREDTYRIDAGDPSSYYKEGPQSFPGFAPASATNQSRKNYAVYLDLAVEPIKALQLDVAGRFEHFTDFGDTQIGKVTARYDFSDAIAVRGTIATGFRAPTPAEEYYTAVNVGPTAATVQLPANSAAAKILGLPNLKPEISTQYSMGLVAHLLDRLSATVDIYSLTLGNRIVPSSTVTSSGGSINTPLVTQAILADGVSLDPTATQQGVTAFLNGINTRTQGVDMTITYISDFADYGSVHWTLAGNYNGTSVSRVAPVPAVLLASNPSASFFNQQSLHNFVHSAPQEKIGLTADWEVDKWGVTFSETYWGPQHSYTSPNSGGELIPFNQAGVGLTDLQARYYFTDAVELSFGGDNIFDISPDKLPFAPANCATAPGVILTPGASCVAGPNNANGLGQTASNGSLEYAPFGTHWNPNGGYYYVRLSYKF